MPKEKLTDAQAETTYTTTVYTYPNATVRVHKPALDAQERERRLQYIKAAATELLRTRKEVKQWKTNL